MDSFTKHFMDYTAEQIIAYIARDYYELSHDKIKVQRDQHKAICKDWLEYNFIGPVIPFEEWVKIMREIS